MHELFGVDIFEGSREEALSACLEMVGEGGAIFTPNASIMRDSVYNDELFRALGRSLNIVDGFGVAAALRWRGISTETFPGIELGEALLAAHPMRFGIIGGVSGIAQRAAARLEEKHRGCTAVLTHDGYTVTEELAVAMIKESRPELVMVCMGSPRQEIFVDSIRDRTTGVLYISLGGAADVYSGEKRRAPLPIRRLRAEWAYRMMREPTRILGVTKLLDFCFLALIEPTVCRKIDKTR